MDISRYLSCVEFSLIYHNRTALNSVIVDTPKQIKMKLGINVLSFKLLSPYQQNRGCQDCKYFHEK